ncbi:717fa764-bd34-4e39-9696-d79da14a0c5f [Thermothielavioides terrestris]|uniref:histone acetyltransferase n=1 Tax=Thermothielavioides terrestris TaxID=2587410 RepID=A0A3S4BNL9_9PEZI|nr:717fa764-bd34-4e39-9696-d79da14a0c5f [Thermothielavioides terrestris]
MSSSSAPLAPKRSSASAGPGSSTANNISSKNNSASSLRERLAAVLPRGYKFGVHHISTPPTRAQPLCPAPPGHRPDKTYKESHFLAVSILTDPANAAVPVKRASPGAGQAKEAEARKRVLVFAIEVFIFTTAYQTTLFVSKADSTGYLHLLGLPTGSPSPIRQVCAIFLAHLLDHRQRRHAQSVVNLFARAQAQYLFPGSVRNKGKHVLDDWGLVRWWCKILNPLMEGLSKRSWGSTKGYLLVPGLEETEMRAFIPRTPASTQNWAIGHPLERISHYTRELDWVPPRCLIPSYPDDPKARFRDELDEEVSKRKQGTGVWKSVRSLGQFWEMMAFRQECSSGRLTGFIWLVFDPPVNKSESLGNSFPSATVAAPSLATPNASFDSSLTPPAPATPPRRRVNIATHTPQPSPLKTAPVSPAVSMSPASKVSKKKARKKLSGRIVPRAPKIKTQARNYLQDRPTTTAYYYWPRAGRGDRLASEAEYKRIVELLLHLDFSTLDKAAGSSQRWLREVGLGDAAEGEVVGKAVVAPESLRVNETAPTTAAGSSATNLTGLIRRKNAPQSTAPDPGRSSDAAVDIQGGLAADSSAAKQVNVLGSGLVRKKKKDSSDDARR